MDKEIESVNQITRRAYKLGYKMLDTNMDEDTIYDKIKKQNVPEKIARQVAGDIILEREKRDYKEERPNIIYLIILLTISIAGTILSAVFTDRIILSFGFILFGALYSTRYYNKRPKE